MPVVLLAAYATGIVLACDVSPGPFSGLYLLTAGFGLAWGFLYRGRWAALPVWGLLCLAGFLQTHHALAGTKHGLPTDDREVIIQARVVDVEQRTAGGNRVLTEILEIVDDNRTRTASGLLLLYTKSGNTTAQPGQVIRWRSGLRRPARFGNPGEFDYPLHLAARGVYLTSFVQNAADLVVLVNHPQQQSRPLQRLRHRIVRHLDSVVDPAQSGYLKSLLLGRKDGLADAQRRRLADSGIAHLFAISGLHFGLLAILLYQVGRWLYTRCENLTLLYPPQRVLPLVLIFPLALYLALTGQAWSTQRAFLMVSTLALLTACGRRTAPFDLLASIALVLLLFNPLALLQPGFQLSFAGVAGILAWLPGLQRLSAKVPRLLRWPVTLAVTTLAATLATAPICMWHFHQLAPAGLLTNFIAIPAIAWVAVPLGLTSLATLPVCPPLADSGLRLTAALVDMTVELAATISTWPGLSAIPAFLTAAELVLILAGLCCAWPFGRSRTALLVRALLIAAALAIAWSLQPPSYDLRVLAFSVGQGDATLVSLANDRHVLVDGGGLPGSSIDPGEQLIAPALGRLGVRALDGVVLTHNHPDHSSGLTAIIRRFPVKRFYFAGDLAELSPSLRLALEEQQVDMVRIENGWHAVLAHGEQQLALFAPRQDSRDPNERSIAVYTGNALNGALLTADLGRAGLQQLSTSPRPGPVDLLKLPHHGSRHAVPAAFLDWTGASNAFVSSGRNNAYGFPHPQTLAACRERQVVLCRTDRQGMLEFRLINGLWHFNGPPDS